MKIYIVEVKSEVDVYAPQIGFNTRVELVTDKNSMKEIGTYSFPKHVWEEIKEHGYFYG